MARYNLNTALHSRHKQSIYRKTLYLVVVKYSPWMNVGLPHFEGRETIKED